MTHCVPDWDGHGGELDAIIATNDYLAPVKGKGWSLVQKRLSSSDLASLQSSDVPSVWAENGQLATKPNENVSRGPEWQQVNSANWSSRQETEDAVTPSKPPSPELIRDGILSVNVPVLDPTVNNNSMAEDEMVSWLTYPLDDNLESAYCSEFFGDLPSSTVGCVNSIKDSLVGQQERQGGYASNRPNGRQLLSVASGSNGSLNRVVSADAAMAMGAGRAAGVLPQAGVEAFTKVRTVQPYLGGKWSPSTPANISGKNLGGTSTSLVQGVRAPPAIMSNVPPPSGLPPLKTQPVRLQPVRKGPINFSHFSVPAVAMKASLQSLGMSHNVPVQNRMKTPYLPNIPISGTRPFDTSTSTGSSIAESTTTGQHSEATASRNDSDVRVEGSEGQQPSLATDSSWPSSMQNSQLSSKDAEAAVNSTGNLMDNESRPSDPENRQQNCSDTSNATQGVDKSVTQVSELPEHPEPTLTSSSGGSGNSGKGVTNKGKRRAREEESECQSDDAEDEVIEFKKPQPRSGTAKRTRAAEVHNLSERRRRDRINEKMKALQELIPNSNKADKASMLDEAIEYLKMLQIQLQMMSMRSGMSIPSLIPNGMQHLQVSQIGGMAPMGMGMGMGLGMGMAPMVGMGGMLPMGMGMPDMNPMAAGRTSHLMPHLSHPGASHRGSPMIPHPSHGGASYNVSQVITHPTHGGSSHNVSATSPAVSIVDSTDLRLPSTSALESVYLARQHPLHLTPQTMDVYNAYMIHQQQQQQQQHHQQHLQQQQQHHQLHHMPSDMGSGSLQ